MKTIKDYEKEFDEADLLPHFVSKTKLKNYIFQELLPQVLSEIIKNKTDSADIFWDAISVTNIKQKAKEMWIKF